MAADMPCLEFCKFCSKPKRDPSKPCDLCHNHVVDATPTTSADAMEKYGDFTHFGLPTVKCGDCGWCGNPGQVTNVPCNSCGSTTGLVGNIIATSDGKVCFGCDHPRDDISTKCAICVENAKIAEQSKHDTTASKSSQQQKCVGCGESEGSCSFETDCLGLGDFEHPLTWKCLACDHTNKAMADKCDKCAVNRPSDADMIFATAVQPVDTLYVTLSDCNWRADIYEQQHPYVTPKEILVARDAKGRDTKSFGYVFPYLADDNTNCMYRTDQFKRDCRFYDLKLLINECIVAYLIIKNIEYLGAIKVNINIESTDGDIEPWLMQYNTSMRRYKQLGCWFCVIVETVKRRHDVKLTPFETVEIPMQSAINYYNKKLGRNSKKRDRPSGDVSVDFSSRARTQ